MTHWFIRGDETVSDVAKLFLMICVVLLGSSDPGSMNPLRRYSKVFTCNSLLEIRTKFVEGNLRSCSILDGKPEGQRQKENID